MKIKVENIGKVKSAAVEIKGLTVIAGPNASGKSIIAKCLYASLYSLKDLKKKVFLSKKNWLLSFQRELSESLDLFTHYELSSSFFDEKNMSINWGVIAQEIESSRLKEKKKWELRKKLLELQEISDDRLSSRVIQLTLSDFFNNQLLNVWSQKDGEISVELAKKTPSIGFFQFK